MADLTITAASVAKGAGASVRGGTLGQAGTAGTCVRLSGSGTLVDARNTSASSAEAVGILLNDGANGQPVDYVFRGLANIGATTVTGERYYVSSTTGGLMPSGDLGSGDFVTLVCIALDTAGNVDVRPWASGVAIA